MNGWITAGVALLLTGLAPPSSERVAGGTRRDFDGDRAGGEPAGFLFARTASGFDDLTAAPLRPRAGPS